MADVKRLRELEAVATRGPWRTDHARNVDPEQIVAVGPCCVYDMALIPAMRNVLPALLDVVEAAKAWKTADDAWAQGADVIPAFALDGLRAALDRLEHSDAQ
jgi:hypothetical protein